MTLFLVNYLKELQNRNSALLPEGTANIKKWFTKRPGLQLEKAVNRLFSLKDEIPLIDPSLTPTLTKSIQNFLMADSHEVSPFVNSERVNPAKFEKYVQQNKQMNELVQAMVTVASMEILNDAGEIKPEIIELLNLTENVTDKDKKTLRDNLIYAFVDGALVKSATSAWLTNPDYQSQVRNKAFSVSLLPTLLPVLVKKLKVQPDTKAEAETNAVLSSCLQIFLKKNPNPVINLEDGSPTQQAYTELANAILNCRENPKQNRAALRKQLVNLLTENYADVADTLAANVKLYPSVYIDRSVQMLTPAITQQVLEKIDKFGMPMTNDFRATDFTDFIMNRINDRAIHVNQILNDEPVVFPEQDIFPTRNGESITQLQHSFKDLLLQNNETHVFIKQWVQSAFEEILDSEGDFNKASVNFIKETFPKSLDKDFNPRNEINDNNVERVRSELLTKKMQDILTALLQERINELDDKSCNEFIVKLTNSLASIHPDMLASIAQLPLLENQARRGDLTTTLGFVFKTLDLSTILTRLKRSTEFAPEPSITQVNQAFMPLVNRHKRVVKKDRNLVLLPDFVNKLVSLTFAQIFDEQGNVRKTVKQIVKEEIDIIACTENLRKVLYAVIAESDVAKEFFLNGTKSADLAKLTSQIAEALALYSDEAVSVAEKHLPEIKKINKEKFITTMKTAMVLFDMDIAISEAGKKIKENIKPFAVSSIQEMEGSFHKLLMENKKIDLATINENTAFKKFITSLTLFAYAEVLDENGNLKLPGSADVNDEMRALFVAAYVRKILITIATRWLANEAYQQDGKKLAATALEDMLTAIENTLKQGVDVSDSLKSMQGFLGTDLSRFKMPLNISPPKTDTSLLDLFADPTEFGQTTANTQNSELGSFYEAESKEDNLKADIDEILRLLPGVNDFFPQGPAITTLADIVADARNKQALVDTADEEVQEFNKNNKPVVDKLYKQTELTREMLNKVGVLVKEVGENFPESGIILKKIRNTYRELSSNMAIINNNYRELIRILSDLKANVFTYSKSTLQIFIDKLKPRKLQITSTIAKVDLNVEELSHQVKAWMTNKDRLQKIKKIGDAVPPDLNKLAVEIHRKKREVATARKKYLQRKHIVMAMQPKDFVWDDFKKDADVMDNVIDNMSDHMRLVQEKFADICKAPIEELQTYSVKSLTSEIERHKLELNDNRAFVLETADTILTTTDDLIEKVDKVQAIHARIFSKFNFILMDNTEFWERRIGLFGRGTPFIVNDGEHREHFFPKRAVAMMHAIKGLTPDQDPDLKNRAIMEAFFNTTAGWSLGQSKKTSMFYNILESLKKVGNKDFYDEAELTKIDNQLDAFMQAHTQRYNLATRYLATLWMPGVAPTNAATVYAALATKEEFPHGDLHLYHANRRHIFAPMVTNNDDNKKPEKEPAKTPKIQEQEEKTWDPESLFINSRKVR